MAKAAKVKIVLFRAAADDYVSVGYSFAKERSSAEAYLDNPGFGGDKLYRAIIKVDLERVADLRGRDVDEVVDEMGVEHPGAIGLDEWVTHMSGGNLRRAFVAKGFQWIIVDESFPEGTETWVWLGEGDEPELKRVRG